MGSFGAMVKAESGSARVTAEREEVELMAVGELAVSTDRFEVRRIHFGV